MRCRWVGKCERALAQQHVLLKRASRRTLAVHAAHYYWAKRKVASFFQGKRMRLHVADKPSGVRPASAAASFLLSPPGWASKAADDTNQDGPKEWKPAIGGRGMWDLLTGRYQWSATSRSERRRRRRTETIDLAFRIEPGLRVGWRGWGESGRGRGEGINGASQPASGHPERRASTTSRVVVRRASFRLAR